MADRSRELIMLEVEIKFPVPDFGPIEQQLGTWGARVVRPRAEADHYYNAPDRDFASTDEALRLRRVGAANFVTYKGPKRDTQTKTRTEVEVPLAEGDDVAADFGRLLEHLGYRPVAVVRKRRRILQLEREGFNLEFCLDEVEGLGTFVEIETLASEARLPAARDLIVRTAGLLGLKTSERRSYLELLLTRQGETRS
jgi:adenylate cyclase class 2